MVLISLLLVCVGLVIVVLSADEAIKRILNLSRYFHLSEFTTSFVIAGIVAVLPELTIGVVAALEGTSSLGFGVILGANVADLTLVIGVVVLFARKLRLSSATIKQMRMSFIAVILPVVLFLDQEISRIDGIILLVAFAIYVLILLRSKQDAPHIIGNKGKIRFLFEITIFSISIGLLFIGGGLITESSQELSLALGLPLFVIGIIVAVGTCLPEMSFAIRSCTKKHCELGLGNILGNVLADSMLTIGIIALIQPIKPTFTAPPLTTGIFMVITALVVFILSRDGELDRKDGTLLLSSYIIFLIVQSIIEGFSI